MYQFNKQKIDVAKTNLFLIPCVQYLKEEQSNVKYDTKTDGKGTGSRCSTFSQNQRPL